MSNSPMDAKPQDIVREAIKHVVSDSPRKATHVTAIFRMVLDRPVQTVETVVLPSKPVVLGLLRRDSHASVMLNHRADDHKDTRL